MKLGEKIKKQKPLHLITGIVLGGILGYGLHSYIGCISGSCAITSNPFYSTIYGSFFGFILALK